MGRFTAKDVVIVKGEVRLYRLLETNGCCWEKGTRSQKSYPGIQQKQQKNVNSKFCF